MQAVAAGDQMTVGSRYDQAGRLLSATVVRNGAKTEDWTYTYDARGNIATTLDAVSGWAMRTLGRDAENRATQIAGNSGQASIGYDERGRVKSFGYNEPASSVNGGLARVLAVDYQYAANGSVSSHSAKVSTNGAWWQPISDAELGVWLTNWELGNDPVAPPANLTGLQTDAQPFVPSMCVECYMPWKAEPVGKLFGRELSATLLVWAETIELMLSDQAQIPYPVLVPDVTSSAKRSTLYSALFGAAGGDGGMVRCGGREDHESECYSQFEYDRDLCTALAGPRSKRMQALCMVGVRKISRMQRLLMAKHPPYSVVLSYDENLQQLIAYTIEPNMLTPLLAGRMGVVLADEDDFKLDDEFARQLGVGMLNTIALGQPSIKQFMSVSEGPIDRPSEE
ncbi:hypothetical protein P3T43_000856 [Paraburkholderia sp. GAS41]|uniref:RHS repeat domain-containing protein n=1 Tax=Paraburkholderia sp. GAS41 TaxID=3035134 RepID=UPI003D1B8B27